MTTSTTLIARNKKLYQNPKRSFLHLDATLDPLPKADMVLCRDLLVHLSFEKIFLFFHNLKKSGSKYLLTTHYSVKRPNIDILSGDWRHLNFTCPPFNFSKPLIIINEKYPVENQEDKSLALWQIEKISIKSLAWLKKYCLQLLSLSYLAIFRALVKKEEWLLKGLDKIEKP